MKKNILLTFVLALLCSAATWAQFAPTEGTPYALQETTTGLYLDIQTLGINEPNAGGTTNNISLATKPCVIYFAAGTTDTSLWTMQNVNGTYAMQASSRNWNAVIGETAYEWTIAESSTSGAYTIARADGGYISMDTATDGQPLYCDKSTGLEFTLVAYENLPHQLVYTLKGSDERSYAIQSSDNLNAVTTATKIVIKNLSSTNSLYMAGTSNQANAEDAILVWEPVTEGTAGEYYLRTTDETKGYIQASTASNATITLGEKTTAQVFYTTAPSTTGSDATYFNGETLVDGADTDNLVRFVQKDASTWLNVNGASNAPRLGNEGKGGWTVHNVSIVADGTFMNLTKVSDTNASFQTTPTEFYVKPTGDLFYIESKADAGTYIGSTHDWNVTADFSVWKILDADTDGYAQIVRASDATKYLGHDSSTAAGTGIYTNVGSASNGWFFTGTYDYTTTGTSDGSQYSFTSDYITYAGACNIIRFTLTESDAYYENGAKRLSFDTFELYDADGNKVSLTTKMITGNNNKTYDDMLDGTSGTYSNGSWNSNSQTDDWFEINLGAKIDLGGAFKFSFVTENTTMNAKAFEIVTTYERPSDYTFVVSGAPADATYSVTYDGNAVAVDDLITVSTFDSDLLVATEIAGYTWSVSIDDENEQIVLTYTEAPSTENPDAVVALINRVGGDSTADKFKFVLDPSMNSKSEVFVIGREDGKILIKGTTISAITTGIGWYLNNYAKINISWNSLNEKTVSGAAYADLSNIPVPTGEETRTSDAVYRYYLNTCTFGYSMTSWTWKRWQQEIDWMALHGINMPLQLIGLEEVWRKFLTLEDVDGNRKYGYTDEEAKAFVAGPAFIAWWAMNNLEGWGGTAEGSLNGGTWAGAGGVQDDAWYERQQALATQILARQRELGMQPVLPGWSGMVPTNFASKSGYTTRDNGGNWVAGFVRPLILDVSNSNYADIAADYYACLEEVMGESQYYSMDPFHESGGTGTTEDYEAMYEAMEAAMPGSQWVIQQWQWTSSQKLSLTAVPEGRLVVLDLFSDGSPAFDTYSGYAPQDAVYCAIPNFGGRSGLMGRLNNVVNNYFTYKAKYSTIKGIGSAPEAIEQTPVTYDLIYQLPWMGTQPDVQEWVANYATARYGANNAVAQEAWELLRQGVLNYGADGIQGPVEDVWAAKPNLTANKASSWGKTLNDALGTYTKARQQMLVDATYKLLAQSEALGFTAGDGSVYESNFNYDIVEFTGGVLADYAYYLLLGIGEAKDANGTSDATYQARRDAFLQLILDVDAFKGTNLNFRLGKWTQEARDAAQEAIALGATDANADWYEYNNARTIISTWSSPGTNLNDYSYRSWQGLMKDLYYPRWKYYFDNDCTDGNYDYFAWNWAHGLTHEVGQTAVSTTALTAGEQGHTDSYTRDPEGNTIETANEVLAKYIIPVPTSSGTYYAYRYLENDLSSICTIIATAGGTIDLTEYFGEMENVTVAGDFISGDATDLSNIAISADIADGVYTGTITATDGTVITFAVVINPPFNGVYKLYVTQGTTGTYFDINADVFVAYNTNANDNPQSVGYKLLVEGDNFTPTSDVDGYFSIIPSGDGYAFQAQGLYMKAPQSTAGWGHILFSDNSAEAGVYLINEPETDVFSIESAVSGATTPYLNAWDAVKYIFGNDNKYSTFTITEVTEYTVTIPANGLPINMPFNIVLPEGVTAYDVLAVGTDKEGNYVYETTLLASAGETVKAGTPVILKATSEGDYVFEVTVSNTDAKSALAGSVLRGNFLAEELAVSSSVSRYTFSSTDATFNLMSATTSLAANSAWMELGEEISTAISEGEIYAPFAVVGAVYRIKSVVNNAADDYKVHYIKNNNATIALPTTVADDDKSALWVCTSETDGKYTFVSALATAAFGWQGVAEDAFGYTLSQGTEDGYLTLADADNSTYLALTAEGYNNASSAALASVATAEQGENFSTDWVLEPVTGAGVAFDNTIPTNKNWGTMYLPYTVEIPEGVEVYYATTSAIDGKTVQLTAIEDYIPKNTPVLLYRGEGADNSTSLKLSFAQADELTAISDNLLEGKILKTAIPATDYKVYLLVKYNNKEAFYWVADEYDANCNVGSSGSGYVKCDANKAFFKLAKSGSTASSYSFVFDWEGTTDIEEIFGGEAATNGDDAPVYDLQGRRVIVPVKGGLYIKNGEKFIAK